MVSWFEKQSGDITSIHSIWLGKGQTKLLTHTHTNTNTHAHAHAHAHTYLLVKLTMTFRKPIQTGMHEKREGKGQTRTWINSRGGDMNELWKTHHLEGMKPLLKKDPRNDMV